MVEPGQLRRWKDEIPLLPHERKCAGGIFLVVKLSGSGSRDQMFVNYLENEEMCRDFVNWVEKWSETIDEAR